MVLVDFTITAQEPTDEGVARAGLLTVRGKVLHTPCFMPVGTLATVKSLTIADLTTMGAECILGNTYHLHLRPGEDLIQELGGIHQFMGGWPGLVLTDSGGYQVFRLAHLRKLDRNGVTFRAHTDGSTHVFTPESVVETQEKLDSDIMMALDECPAHTMTETEAAGSSELTFNWANRSRAAWSGRRGALFGICQGGMFAELRRQSARQLASLDLPGYGIGGLGLGESKEVFREMVLASTSELPAAKPRYLMGIGRPEDLVNSVAMGVDMFDCVLQTREARNGALLTNTGRLNVNNARCARDPGPIELDCDCETCQTYSLAYLHHLFRNRELLGYRLATIHNLRWTLRLMEKVRDHIADGTYGGFRISFTDSYRTRPGDPTSATAGASPLGGLG